MDPVAAATYAALALAALGALVGVVRGILVLWRALRRRGERPAQREPDDAERTPAALAPPPADPDFVGRKRELDDAVAVLVGDEPLGICGGPGIGKSTLARQLAHDARIVAHFPDGILWVAGEGLGLDRICETIGTALGTTDVAAQPTTERKLAALRAILAGARLLIILDNADDPASARRFAQDVHGFTLITSRDRVTDIESRSIDPLQPDEAVKLIAAKADRAGRTLAPAEHDLLPQIAAMLENHPLALVLAGGQLPDMGAQDLLAALADSRLDQLIDPNDPKRSVRRSFETSYDRLSPEDARLFAALGVFGGKDFSLDAVRAVDDTATAQRLAFLVQRSLARHSDGRYSLHLLLRDYAREKLADDQTPYRRAAAYYLEFAAAHRQVEAGQLAALDVEITNILAAMDWCQAHEEWESVTAFARFLADYLNIRGLWTERLQRALRGAEAAAQTGDRPQRAACLHSAGIAHQQRGDYPQAKHLYQESLAIKDELGDRSGIAASKHQLGIIAQLTGDYPQARRLYQESLTIDEELGDRSGIAISKHQLGIIAQFTGDYPQAKRLYQESLAILEELGDRHSMASPKHQLGIMAQDTGDYPQAKRLYQESLAIKDELGDRSGIAVSKHQLGIIAQLTGDYPQAKRLYQKSLAILEELGDKSGIAKSKHQLAMIAELTSDHPQAKRLYQESLAIKEDLGDKSGIAMTKGALGTLAEATGDVAAAKQLYQEALAILEELGAPQAATARDSLERVKKRRQR